MSSSFSYTCFVSVVVSPELLRNKILKIFKANVSKIVRHLGCPCKFKEISSLMLYMGIERNVCAHSSIEYLEMYLLYMKNEIKFVPRVPGIQSS